MCEQTEIDYLDGDIVWVKLGSCWWPGEVVGPERLPPDVLPSFRKPPIAVVKFFQESTYEYVKNINSIYKYNCSKKKEFINKGLYMYRSKHAHMEKFPEDVIRAETAVGGDQEILTREEFQEQKKPNYAGLFGNTPKKSPALAKKGRGGRGRPSESPHKDTPSKKFYKEKSDYKVHILLQGSRDSQRQSVDHTPTTSLAGSEPAEEKSEVEEKPLTLTTPNATPTVSVGGVYSCHSCPFTTSRLNVMIMHNKTHSSTYVPYTPSPIRKKTSPKSTTKSVSKSTTKATKLNKASRSQKEKSESSKKRSKKRPAEEPKSLETEVKKLKKDQEIKSSLLADWDDDVEGDSNDESTVVAMSGSPEMPIGAESPAVPELPLELPSAQVPEEFTSSPSKKSDEATEKAECSSDSKYEFCEDEDWAVEADVGRKIPRVKNPSKRQDETKSLSIDEDDVAKEVAELLNKTSVPELPSIPEPVKAEENFPDPPVIKSPDKKSEKPPEPDSSEKTEARPTKAIFKTKTFFRSRHSRSQDVIGKYVAEQLNAAERLNMSEYDLNGSEAVSSPEARESPPVEQLRTARLAPKIQLKKMKAEAQLRQKEKSEGLPRIDEMQIGATSEKSFNTSDIDSEKDSLKIFTIKPSRDVLYPTQEIKPINKEVPDKLISQKEEKIQLNVCKTGGLTTPEVESPKSDTLIMGNLQPISRMDDDLIREIDILDNNMKTQTKITNEEELNNQKGDDLIQEIDILDTNIATQTKTKTENELNSLPLEIATSTASLSTGTNDSTVEEVNISLHSHNNIEETKVITFNVAEKSDTSNSQNSLSHLTKAAGGNDELMAQKDTNSKIELSLSIEDAMPKESIIDSEVQSFRITKASPKKCSQLNVKTPKSESLVSKAYTQLIQPYMNESTASAVDALLSVSRETDRVPKIVSNDPPEDLFEDDHREVVFEENVAEVSVTEDTGDFEESQNNCTNNQIAGQSNDLKTTETTDGLEITNNQHNLESSSIDLPNPYDKQHANQVTVQDSRPSESDLQIAETLLNLPATAMQNNSTKEQHQNNTTDHESKDSDCIQNQNIDVANDESKLETEVVYDMEQSNVPSVPSNIEGLKVRYETEQEKSENLNAAQSLVQMSESIDHKINVVEANESKSHEIEVESKGTTKIGIDNNNTVENNIALLSSENRNDSNTVKSPNFETTSSKLLKILEEPTPVKNPVIKSVPMKPVIIAPKEKILNLDVAESPLKAKTQTTKQKIIIRRGPPNKTIINNLTDVVASPENIILSRNTSQDGSSIQTFTIQSSPEIQSSNDPKQIIIQPKFRKVTKQPKIQKIKSQNSMIEPVNEKSKLNEEPIFDINSMPVVLSEDILTPESIEHMPIVMSDGNIISSSTSNTLNPPKLIKTKPTIIENEKVAISKVASSSLTEKNTVNPISSKPEVKTLLINTSSDIQKTTPPNILSKSSKLRGGKPMLVIDKATGKQKIIMAKAEPSPKELKQPTTLIQPVPLPSPKTEKFIILPTTSSPRAGRTQKIVIDPQTGKACVLVAKGQDAPTIAPEHKPVSAKIIPSSPDATTPGNTVMIITNAQGAQSRIVLTPEHEKILFPNKQQPNVSQLKAITHRISTNPKIVQKTIVSSAPTSKTQTRIVPKQKSAIITSKGQLIVGGRVATTTQNIAPMTEIRPAPKRITAAEPKRLVQTIAKNSSEPIIFLQQKSGAVMQLTAAQFEHLQRTGQIIQKSVSPVQETKKVVQKSINVAPKETIITPAKPRIRKIATESTTLAKKPRQEVAIAPSPATLPPLTALSAPQPASLVTISSIVPTISNAGLVSSSQSFGQLDNFEELLPSTAIARQSELAPQTVAPAEPPAPELQPAQLADGQLLAVPGESFGGPPGSFYLCVEENGTYTPIDNRPLMLENNQLVPMAVEQVPVFCPQPERRDILEAALANSDVFHGETHDDAPDFRDLNANVSVHCRVSETSTTLNQPIMTPVEVPSKGESEPTVPSNLEDGLAVIGVTPHTVPTSLELPITVTDPRIAPKTTDPLSNSNYGTAVVGSGRGAGGSLPLLGEDTMGKSMPILTDDDPPRTLLTPCSDTSETSVEIPFQPSLQLSVDDISRHV